MMYYLVKMFGVSLTLTLVVELAVGMLFACVGRMKMKKAARTPQPEATSTGAEPTKPVWGKVRNVALLVLLVNVLTNPPAVLLCWLGRMFLPAPLAVLPQVVVELAVVATEYYVYRSFVERDGWQVGSPLALAVTANICSWTLGLVANRYLWILDMLLLFGR